MFDVIILILMFTAISLFFYSELNSVQVPNCSPHQWSKDFNTEELVCMQCNTRIK